VTSVPGRGASQSNGTAHAPAAPKEPRAEKARPVTPRPDDSHPADSHPVTPRPVTPRPADAGGPKDDAGLWPTPRSAPATDTPVEDGSPDDPSPLAVAVEQTGQWLKKAATATSASMSAAYASLTRPRPKDDSMTATNAPVSSAPPRLAAPPRPAAPPRTVPPIAPATTAGAPKVRPETGHNRVVGPGPRRARLAISRVDPWSVMKLAFLLSFAAGIVLVVAVAVLWLSLDGLHVFASINNLVSQVVGPGSSIDVLNYVAFSKVLSVTTLVAVADVFLLTALATIGAFLYNVVAALVGGVHVTMTDE